MIGPGGGRCCRTTLAGLLRDEGEGMRAEDKTEPKGLVAASDNRTLNEKQEDLKRRLKSYALRILKIYDSLPKHGSVHIITHQLARSGTSPGAHYREACRAKSDADFISKIEGGLQELDESHYWLELLVDGDHISDQKLLPLIEETNELIAIFVSIVTKVKSRKSK